MAGKNWKYITPEEGDAFLSIGIPVWYRSREGRGFPWYKANGEVYSLERIDVDIKEMLANGRGKYFNNKRQLANRKLVVRVEVE